MKTTKGMQPMVARSKEIEDGMWGTKRLSVLDWEGYQIITAPEKGPAPREPTVWWRDRARTILTRCDSPSTVQGSEGGAEFYPQILPFPAVWSLGASVSSVLQGRVRMRRESV